METLAIYTVIYCVDDSLEIQHVAKQFAVRENGRVVIPESFKDGKIIIAVCEGNVPVLNKLGDRLYSPNHAA